MKIIIYKREGRRDRRRDNRNLLEGLDHAVLRIEPLHLVDQRRLVHLRLAGKDDAGPDRLRLRLAIRQDFQVRIHRVSISCKKKIANVIMLTRKTSMCSFARVTRPLVVPRD